MGAATNAASSSVAPTGIPSATADACQSTLFAFIGRRSIAEPTARAAPGHGEAGHGLNLAHDLTEPIHVLGGFVVVSVALATAQTIYRCRRSFTPPTP